MATIFCELSVAFFAVYGLYCAFYGLFFRMALEKRRGLRIVVEREPSDRLCVRMYVAKKLMGTKLFDRLELMENEPGQESEDNGEEAPREQNE
ncbi:MAG: hypothetical protein E7655_06495 [Ruminococcaceae bacterium]|nr:hypothetical protein [Oscillospiraceae bacterium]